MKVVDYPAEAEAQSIAEPELLPCPFAHVIPMDYRPPVLTKEMSEDSNWCVYCPMCSAATGFHDYPETAITYWNTRSRPTVAENCADCGHPLSRSPSRYCAICFQVQRELAVNRPTVEAAENKREMKYAIKYRGVLTEMWVTGFSEPIQVDDDSMRRSVKASNLISDAHLYSDLDISTALTLTQECFPDAVVVNITPDVQPSVEAAEVCAEMARHEAMLAAKAQSEDSLDTVYYGHKFASDALREAEKRIRAATPAPSAAEIRCQAFDDAAAICEQLVTFTEDHGNSDDPDIPCRWCDALETAAKTIRDAAPAPSKVEKGKLNAD